MGGECTVVVVDNDEPIVVSTKMSYCSAHGQPYSQCQQEATAARVRELEGELAKQREHSAAWYNEAGTLRTALDAHHDLPPGETPESVGSCHTCGRNLAAPAGKAKAGCPSCPTPLECSPERTSKFAHGTHYHCQHCPAHMRNRAAEQPDRAPCPICGVVHEPWRWHPKTQAEYHALELAPACPGHRIWTTSPDVGFAQVLTVKCVGGAACPRRKEASD